LLNDRLCAPPSVLIGKEKQDDPATIVGRAKRAADGHRFEREGWRWLADE